MRKIEIIKKKYLDQVFGIEQLSNSTPWSYSSFIDCMNKNYQFYVCTDNKKVIGFFIASFSLLEGHLLNISVAPNRKRQGVGNILLNKIESIAIEYGIKEIFLEVRESNREAIALYENNGYRKIGLRKNYYKLSEGREDAVIYSKKIKGNLLSLKQIFYILSNIFRFRIR